MSHQSSLTSGSEANISMSSYTAENDSNLYSPLECFECKVIYNTTNCRQITDACGHKKCRICFISDSDDGCLQCRMDKNGLNENLNSNSNGEFPPPPKLPKAKNNLNSGSRMQANISTDDWIKARITINDIRSLATPESSKTIHDENSSNNVIEKSKKSTSKKKWSRVLIPSHITVLSSSKEGEPDTYQCNICMKQFKTKNNINYHNFCPSGGEKPFKCETCGEGFITKSHYKYHLRTHTGERPYICLNCGKGFIQKGKLTVHLRSHTGERPFVCEFCARGFKTPQALKAHNMIHTGEKPYSCQICYKRFTGMTNLKTHVISHTGEKPFECIHCGKSFVLKWTLGVHLRTHSSEKPHACDKCVKAFNNSKDLKRHLMIHSGERPYKCWICGTAFRRKDHLGRHITTIHNQPPEVARQLANEAAAEYLASQKAKAPNPTAIPTSLNLNVNKPNSSRLSKGASTSMSNDKSKKIQEAVIVNSCKKGNSRY